MSSFIGRAAFRASRPLRATGATIGKEGMGATAEREAGKASLQKGAQRDPELYVSITCSTLYLIFRQKGYRALRHSPMPCQSTMTDDHIPFPDPPRHHVQRLRSRRMALQSQPHFILFREPSRQGPRLRALEHRRACRLPIPPGRRHQQGAKKRPECVERGHYPECQPAEGESTVRENAACIDG